MPNYPLLILLLLTQASSAYAAAQPAYALVFFYRSDCPYCHEFAPKFKALTQKKQLPSYVFSLDNQPLPDYPAPIPVTPDISQRFFDNPRSITVPATFLLNVNSHKFVRVSVGNVSYAELEQSVDGILSDQRLLSAMQ
ncbi:type-F conjugative transfer system pilin assembly thiol-disulfide isomerase TrbB [Vibrio brasiliensis]|uniref:type-F conjugative transfer system pilin assembly thiol-disulfide isomerase TrbB n=1 Tax=Vibrio brasiliensis TaxID=170652 RepID=UPI001EFCCF49|nr:type-F conjugative transfer system pilin assembly thiol-disulfide isomerase TrbB [Vibrio brasiliensis]MCG9727492.1 type-F conjugative transfer system pilin assembly thiol-disulfide isomerase TrbB [Vibrio brasiliensis]MCG9784516.1 type-F conjugative transfer system pilin assembly thiol-disulfide isomerase TrbB [Vibrio brasiliensis]